MVDLTLARPSRRGHRGRTVRLVQEWLSLQGLHVKIDGDFGPATEAAVRQFQMGRGLPAVLEPIAPEGRSLGELFVAYAAQHLAQRPREIGGQNRGLRLPMPITPSFSCDSLAASAKARRLFLKEPPADDRRALSSGSIFLSRRTPTDWVHTGVVVEADREVLRTIEGNTNDDGDREGYEVCARTRGYRRMDFIRI